MKDLSYKTIFGKSVSHIDAVKERLVNIITDIITKEEKISEKDFKRYDIAIEQAENIVTDDFVKQADEYIQSGRRMELLAEIIYDKTKANPNQVMTFEKYNNSIS